MADVLNSFEGGTNGATITTGNSGGASGSAFGFVQIPAGGSAIYTTTSYRGTLAGQFSTGSSAAVCQAEYSTAVGAASTGQVFGRLRFRIPSLPPDATGIRVAVICDSTGSFRAEVRVNNTGTVTLRNSAGTTIGTFTDTYVAGAWWDVGMAILVFSTTVGQMEAKKYDASGVATQTITSAANQNTTGSGGTNKLQVGVIRSLAGLTVQVDDVAWSTTAYPTLPAVSNPTVTYGPWSGGVTDDQVTVTYVMASTTSARLVVSTSSDLSSPIYSSAVGPDASNVVKLTASGLPADTQLYYGVEADGTVLAGGRGEVRTFPTPGTPANFSVAFGSCQFTVPSDSTFTAIMNRSGVNGRALQLIHMGDMNYRDWDGTATASDILAQHMTSLASGSMAPMLSKIPINYIWDNHDWGGDNSDRTAAAGDLVAQVYRQVYPTYPLPATNGRGAYHSWVVGRIRFIQLDVRSYRDPQSNTENSSKTMLGTEQKAWLKDELIADEPLKILCANYPWRDDGDGSGRWGSYSPEFTELSDYIDANALGQVYVIFGDRHYLAADDGTSSGTRGIPQAGGAPFQQSTVAVTNAWSQGSYTIAPSTLQAYGWLDITDDGQIITIDYAGVTTADGLERVSMTTVFNTGLSFGDTADTLVLSDAATATVTRVRTVAEGLNMPDTATGTVARVRAVAQSITLADAAVKRVTALKSTADTLVLGDATSNGQLRKAAGADTLTLADASSRTTVRARSVADTLTLADEPGRGPVSMARAAAEAIALAAEAAAARTLAPRVVADSVALAGAAGAAVVQGRFAYDGIRLEDSSWQGTPGAPIAVPHKHYIEMTAGPGIVDYVIP